MVTCLETTPGDIGQQGQAALGSHTEPRWNNRMEQLDGEQEGENEEPLGCTETYKLCPQSTRRALGLNTSEYSMVLQALVAQGASPSHPRASPLAFLPNIKAASYGPAHLPPALTISLQL